MSSFFIMYSYMICVNRVSYTTSCFMSLTIYRACNLCRINTNIFKIGFWPYTKNITRVLYTIYGYSFCTIQYLNYLIVFYYCPRYNTPLRMFLLLNICFIYTTLSCSYRTGTVPHERIRSEGHVYDCDSTSIVTIIITTNFKTI